MTDLRLITVAKRFFRLAPKVGEVVLLDQIMSVFGCSERDARGHVTDLVLGGYVTERASSTGTSYVAGPNLDTEVLRLTGVVIAT